MKNLLIDGLSGSGKWVIARMCCSIEGAISLGMDEQFEILLNSNYISPNQNFEDVLRYYTRIRNYEKFIGRNFNIRKKDITYSGIYPFSSEIDVSKRDEKKYLFEGNNDFSIIETHGGAFCGISDYLKFFKKSIFMVRVKRNPQDIIKTWINYVDRYGNDLSERTFCFKYKNKVIPWFVKGFENEFINAKTSLEKVIIVFLSYEKFNKKAKKQNHNNDNIIEIEFDNFVKNPYTCLSKIADKLGSGKIDKKIFKKLCVELEIPRNEKWINRGYWKEKNNFDLNLEIKKLDDNFKHHLEKFLNFNFTWL